MAVIYPQLFMCFRGISCCCFKTHSINCETILYIFFLKGHLEVKSLKSPSSRGAANAAQLDAAESRGKKMAKEKDL